MKIKRTFNWPYQICSAIVLIEYKKTEVTFYKNVVTNDIGSEVYTGENYIVGSTDKSYSRNYPNEEMVSKQPKKYRDTVDALIADHNSFEGWEEIKHIPKATTNA